jgi:crotonobetaine/carnitine-CoA ligase
MNILEFSDPRERHLGRAIQMQAEQQGDALFIMFGERRYTYAEVNQ